MNLLQMSERDIQDYIDDAGIYHRGRMYSRNGFVEDIHVEEAKGLVVAKVRGSQSYTVTIQLNSRQDMRGEACTCPYFREWRRPCKHIAAVLFEYRMLVENKYARYRNSHKAVHAIFQKLQESKIGAFRSGREQIHLFPNLSIYQQGKVIHAYMELRVGVSRPYVVKNAEEFMEAWEKGKKLVYGRQFTLDSSTQYFTGQDELVMKTLKDIYTTHLEMVGFDSSYRYGGLIKNRQFQLMPTTLARFLDDMLDGTVCASVLSLDTTEVPVIRETIPVTYEIRQLEGFLSVKLNPRELPVELVPDGPYYYFEGKIYRIPDTQRKYLSIVQEGFKEAESHEMIVPLQYQNRFISEVVPMMKKTGDVMVNPSLKEQIVQAPLKIEVYLDQYNKGISARVLFHYGAVQVNPAARIDLSISDGVFILRDMEEEQKILDFLYQNGFSVEQDQFCLMNKEEILLFVFEQLPVLQTLADVYYSGDFKKITVKKRIHVSGKVSLVEDMLEISFETVDMDRDELKSVLEALQKKKKYYRLKDGAILPLDEYPVFQEIAYFADQMDINPKDLEGGTLRIPKYRALYLESLASEANNSLLEKTSGFQQFVEGLTQINSHSYEPPISLQAVMRDYQKAGYEWMKVLSNNGLGGILADDMGLGKTLQVLALVLSERKERKPPALVISPTSLVYNWVLEAKKFTPELKVLAVSGHQLQRQGLLEKIEEYDLVITSYPLIRRDIAAYQKHLFSFCFIDEAQHVKNHFTQSARAIRKISARNYFALTGTPMENSLMELWAIFDFIMPSYLFTRQKFQDRFLKPIMGDGSKEASADLYRHIQPFILRRMKKDVLKELPEKIETTLTCELTAIQKDIYYAILIQARKEIETSLEKQGYEKSQLQILAALTRLRQICCHPSTFLEGYSGGSGKLNLLEEILGTSLESGHRILLFSQFTSMLDILEKEFIHREIPYFYLSGKTPATERASIVERFNEGEGRVFLLSLKAGGTGLTLTGADTVIHYDPWWNPAVEEQATDRAYRIGQKKVVQVFKLITRNTIEEKILLLQEKKREMIDRVIKPGETMLSKLTKEEIIKLFELQI